MTTRMTLLNNESDIINGERYNKKITDVVDELKTNQKQEYERVTGTENETENETANETANENLVTKTNKIPNKVDKKQILGINSLLFGLGATLLVFGVGYLAIKQKWVE